MFEKWLCGGLWGRSLGAVGRSINYSTAYRTKSYVFYCDLAMPGVASFVNSVNRCE